MVHRHAVRQSLGLATAFLLAVSASASAAEPRLVKLHGSEAMQYDVKLIQAKAGEAIKIQLSATTSMSKQEMAHNFVLLAKGAPVDAVVMDGAMARNSEYIPASRKAVILANTKLAGNGETVEVVFNAPKEPGEYNYICTFPGHYLAGMKGKLVVK